MRLVCVCAPASHRERASSVLFFFFFQAAQRGKSCVSGRGRRKKDYMKDYSAHTLRTEFTRRVRSVRATCVCVCFFSSDASRKKKGRCEVDGTRSSELSWVRWPEPPLSASFPEKKRPERERKREGSGEEVCAGCRGFQLLVSGSLS